MTAPAQPKKQTKPYASRMLRCVIKLGVGIILIAGAALLALNFWLAPRIDNYRPWVQEFISARINAPVSIGRITAQRDGLLPQLKLSDVRFSNPDGSDGLVIQKIRAALSVKSLLVLQVRFSELRIEEPQVYVQRHSNGHFWVAGIDITQLFKQQPPQQESEKDTGEVPPIILWLLRQPEITIHNGFAQWFDQITAAPEFELTEINVWLNSTGRDHQIQIQATPPTDWGDRFTFKTTLTEPLLATASHPANWDATAYSLFPRVDVKELSEHIQLPIQLVQGRGFFEATGEYKNGELVHSQMTFKLPEVELITRPDLAPIHLQDFHCTLTGTWQKDVLRIQTDDLTFRYAPQPSTNDSPPLPEQVWPASRLDISWKFDEQGKLHSGVVQTGQINLKILSRLALGLPLSDMVQQALTGMNAQGQVEFLDVAWSGPTHAPSTYSFKGRVRDLQATAGKAPPIPAGKKVALGRPGIENLSLSFSVNEKQGQAQLAIDDGSITLPGLYDEARVPIKRLRTTLHLLYLQKGQIEIQVPAFNVITDGGELDAQISWKSPDPFDETDPAGYFTMNGTLSNGNAIFVSRYLPNSIQAKVRDYLKAALVEGTVPKATVRIEGTLVDFPYHEKETGIFLIEGRAQNVTYDFAPRIVQPDAQAPWPVLTDVQGDAQFTGKGMMIRNATGQIRNTPGSQFFAKEVSIPDWGSNDTHVLIVATINGSANALLHTVNQSAIGQDLLKGMLSLAAVTGKISTQLELDIVLDNMPDTAIKGTIDLSNQSISLWPFVPELRQTKGQVVFTEKGFSATNLHARTLGGTVQGHAQMDITQGLAIDLHGDLTAQGLFDDPNWGKQLLPELNWLDGATTYTFQADSTNGKQTMRWQSDLTGLGIQLPEPFDKPAPVAYPLQITLAPLPTDLRFLPMSIEVNTLTKQQDLPRIQASYMLRETDSGVMITQGTIGINQTPVMPITGTTAYAQLEHLNIPSWQSFLGALPAAPVPDNPNRTSSSNLVLPVWWPQLTTARIDQFRIGDEFIAHDTQLKIQRQEENWSASMTSKEAIGQLRWRAAKQDEPSSGLLQARFSRLWLPALNLGAADASQTQTPDPEEKKYQENLFTLLPNMRVHVDHLRLGNIVLGQADLDAQIDQTLVPARWRINQFDISNPYATLKTSGYWANTPIPTTSLEVNLTSQNTGQFLTQLGYENLISRAPGTLKGQLSWQALPYAFDLQTLAGELTLKLGKGQVLFADSGAGRLLSVLSLQALPNRLSLDFRDVINEGLAFNTVDGDLTLKYGMMNVSALELSGANVQVQTTGNINLMNHTQQLKVVITPLFDIGTASLALAVVNPAVGLGSLFAQLILQEPFKKLTARTYYVDGNWENPNVSKVRPRTTDPKNKSEQKLRP